MAMTTVHPPGSQISLYADTVIDSQPMIYDIFIQTIPPLTASESEIRTWLYSWWTGKLETVDPARNLVQADRYPTYALIALNLTGGTVRSLTPKALEWKLREVGLGNVAEGLAMEIQVAKQWDHQRMTTENQKQEQEVQYKRYLEEMQLVNSLSTLGMGAFAGSEEIEKGRVKGNGKGKKEKKQLWNPMKYYKWILQHGIS